MKKEKFFVYLLFISIMAAVLVQPLPVAASPQADHMIFVASCVAASSPQADSAVRQDASEWNTFEVPGGLVLGLYDWNGALLVYYMKDNSHWLCLMDPQSGEILAQVGQGYDQGLAIEICEDHRPEDAGGETPQEPGREASGQSDALTEEKDGLTEGASRGAEDVRESAEDMLKDFFTELSGSEENERIFIEDGIFNPIGAGTDGPQSSEGGLPAVELPGLANGLPAASRQNAEDGLPADTPPNAPIQSAAPSELLRLYLAREQKFLWLDTAFEVVDEYVLEREISGQPLMDLDSKYLYYVNLEGGVFRQDWQTGEELVLEAGGPFYSPPYLEGIYNNGTMISISGNFLEASEDDAQENIRFRKNYIDTVDGHLLASTENFSVLSGDGSSFYISMQGLLSQAVFGSFENPEEKWEFIFDSYDEYDNLYAWPKQDRLLTFYTDYGIDNSSTEIWSLYSVESGRKVASLTIPLTAQNGWNTGNMLRPDYACYMPQQDTVAFHLNSQPGLIFVWNVGSGEAAAVPGNAALMEAAQAPEEAVSEEAPQAPEDAQRSYKVPYLPADSEDALLLEELKVRAAQLGSKYSVEIYLGGDCPRQLDGYQTEPSFSVSKNRRALIFMEQALEKYPQDFFGQLAASNGGVLKFYLVRRLVPDGADSLSSTVGLYGGSSGQYIALAIDSPRELETLVFHEITHAIDYKLSGSANQNYEDEQWCLLNPAGFAYAGSYRANAVDTSWEYVFNGTGANDQAYFIDQYSKSFPTEDRARIMEKAMGLYPATAYFTSPCILEKLAYISNAIREGFDTENWPPTLWWERPLAAD